MRKRIILGLLTILAIILIVLGTLLWAGRKALGPALLPIDHDTKEVLRPGVNLTDLPLTIPEGFELSILADKLSNARVIVRDTDANVWVSRPSAGVVTKITIRDNKAVEQRDVLTKLRKPHGLAFDPLDSKKLYIAEENQISIYNLETQARQVIAQLPTGGRHTTRTIYFGSDDKLYVAIGSSCDTCVEPDTRHGTIMTMNRDGSDFKTLATGLRNSVFMTTNPVDGTLWATEMGRDFLGNDLPPDEINIIKAGDYGWPYCYGNRVFDRKFDPKGDAARCANTMPATIELPAHSAPLGLTFIPEEGWPEDFGNSLIVALHGSWNRSEPVGYKLAYIKFNDKREPQAPTDFISGWLEGVRSFGRPVDVAAYPGGLMYISDDKAGVIYQLRYLGEEKQTSLAPVTIAIQQNTEITSPLEVRGTAPGTWFFEANIGLRLEDRQGNVLAQGYAMANGDWMTTSSLGFMGTIEFQATRDMDGYLVVAKDNPSGLPENDDERKLPVKIKVQ